LEDSTTLEFGKPVERRNLRRADAALQNYCLGWSIHRVAVRQSGLDVSEKVVAPDGTLVAEFNSEMRPQGEERADFGAETAGPYRLDIEPRLRARRDVTRFA